MIRKKTVFGAAAAGALAVVGVVGPASAAGELSATVNYDCSGIPVPGTFTIDAPAVSSIVAGQTIQLNETGTFFVNNTTSAAAPGLLGPTTTQIGGSATTKAGGKGVGLNLTLARTPLDPTNGTTMPSSGKVLVMSKAAGTYTLKLADIGSATIQGFDASNNKTGFVQFPDGGAFGPCTNPDVTTPIMNGANPATISVTKDASTTAVTAAFSKVKHQAVGTAKVKGKNFGLTGTGKVTFTLKKGLTTIKTIRGVKLVKGTAKATFKNVTKKGKYSITAKYGGSAGLKGSSGKAGFAVR
jgi:hypothetical protein